MPTDLDIYRGAKLVRPLVVATAMGMALRLIYEEYL